MRRARPSLRAASANVPAGPLAGAMTATSQPLLTTGRLQLEQINLAGATQLPGAAPGKTRLYVLVSGPAAVTAKGRATPMMQGALLRLRGAWPAGATVDTGAGAAFLAIDAPADGERLRPVGTELTKGLLLVGAEEAPTYQPAGHANTSNRLLYIDPAIEVVRGRIGVGGGADAHKHDVQEQLSYVLSPAPPALLFMPPGVMHGGSVNKTALDLIVIYSPPLGETLKYN
jgi:hypothetical protein